MRPDMLLPRLAALACATLLSAGGAWAETELSLYGGMQLAAPSGVSGSDPASGTFAFGAEWSGRSFEMPPYWGLRLTRWTGPRWGVAVEVNHAKVYANEGTLAAAGFSRLEFTDGLNLLTANAMHLFPAAGRLQPYVGAGLGLSVPHVEVTTAAGATFGYQVTGPAVVWIAGASVPLRNERLRVFAEYKGSRSWNKADLDSGGTLEADITTHALNLGLSLRF
jgi:lipid A oxidase